MEVIIRKTRQEDFSGILKILLESHLISTSFTKSQFLTLLRKNRSCCYVAEINKKLVGTVFGMHDGALYGYIYKIAIIKDYRRFRIATRLLKELIDQFRKQGIQVIFAHVKRKNTPSFKLLRSLDFEVRNTHLLMDLGYKKR